MSLKIRTMTIDDYEAVFNLWKNTPGMGLNNLDDSREGIEKYLKRNPTTCFVAERDGNIIGGILSGHDGRRGFIYHLAVDISERRKGIGTKLAEYAKLALEEEGINKVAFVVFTENETGNSFWERLGFEERRDLTYRNKFIGEMIRFDPKEVKTGD